YSHSSEALSSLNERIRTIDLGIEKVQIESEQGKLTPYFTHSGLGAPLSLARESKGTRNFYGAFPYLYFVLSTGGIAILDEFDNDIHPLLLPEIVSWFYDAKRNPHNAQLIISCHNATLLEHLVKEEVFFTEKNVRGETEIYGLKNIQGVRRDTNIYSKYLGGVFGAVPNIG
ncbi:MAG: ATP-binding protein, partial [Candidatus Tectomicrobia bacterium]|nr:ATP-binding protein [Candidatus Tectomicrobia bacterium]